MENIELRTKLILLLTEKLLEMGRDTAVAPTHLLFRFNPVKLADELLKGNAPIDIDAYLNSKADSGA